MERLRYRDLDGVVRAAGEIAALGEDDEPFPQHLLGSLRTLIGSDFAGYCELDRLGKRVLAGVTVPEPGNDDAVVEELYWKLRAEHPVCSYQEHTLDFSSHKISDFVTMQELRRLQIYAEYFRRFDIPHHISVGLPAPLTHTKMFLFDNSHASGDFGERERTILELVRPHLIRRYKEVQARRRAAAALAALETSDQSIVLLDEHGRPEFATPRARRLLTSFGFDVADVPNVRPLLVQNIRSDVLLLEERRPLGLTRREHEILALVAQGKTNAQIAAALWISPATVGKHLENAYAKLGVTNRTAAVRAMHEGASRRVAD